MASKMFATRINRSSMLIVPLLMLMILGMACSGAEGAQGPLGPPGPAGSQGPAGPAGPSSFDSAADTIVSTVTVRSVQDPFPGHEDHQLAILLPPDISGKVFTGTLSYVATKPVEVIVIFPYNPSEPVSEPHGALATVEMEGQPYAFTVILTGKSGTMPFSGIGLALHTLGGEPFETSASIRAIVEDQTPTGLWAWGINPSAPEPWPTHWQA